MAMLQHAHWSAHEFIAEAWRRHRHNGASHDTACPAGTYAHVGWGNVDMGVRTDKDSPDRDVHMSELSDLDIDLDEECPHETPNSPHDHKDG